MRRIARVACLFALLAWPVPASEPPELAVETFDAAWTMIKDTHYDPNLNGVDWDKAKVDLRPKAEQAKTIDELRAAIRELLSRLGESHFALLPKAAVDAIDEADPTAKLPRGRDGDVGLDVRYLDGAAVVVSVLPGGPAEQAGIKPGWILQSIDGKPLDEIYAKLGDQLKDPLKGGHLVRGSVIGRLRGSVGSTVPVNVADADGQVKSLELTRAKTPGEVSRLGNLPAFNAHLTSRRVTTPEGKSVGVIAFNIWLIPIASEFEKAFLAHRDADAIVIDLRGNPGGIGGMAMGLAGWFLDEITDLGEMKLRGNTLHFNANPRKVTSAAERIEPYKRPVALLIDGETGSTSEIFAGGMQAVGRAQAFGTRTMGAALPSVMERLPNGDVLQHAIADFRRPGGRRLEHDGVTPDVEAKLTREDLLAGRDRPLDAALRWIDTKSAP